MGEAKTAPRVYALVPFVMTCSLYFGWGMAHNLNDILIAQFKRAFNLSIFQASLVQSAFYGAYVVMPLIVATVMNRFGYRNAVICGLILYGAGALLFWPAASVHQYGAFLFALFVIACGIVFLETSGVAMIPALGPASGYDWRFNLASSFNALGSITGIFVGRRFIFPSVELSAAQRAHLTSVQAAQYSALQAEAVRWPYLVIGLVLLAWAVAIKLTAFPKEVDERRPDQRFSEDFKALARSPGFVWGVSTQLLYVGAQISCWSFLILYVKAQLPGLTDQSASIFLVYGLCAFLAGRFTTTVCLKWVSVDRICAAMGAASVTFCLIAAFVGGRLGVWSLIGVGFMMSVMYPGIFSMGLRGHETRARTGAALMIMAIIGGALISALMGRVADACGVTLSYLVPGACFAAVFVYAVFSMRRDSTTTLHELARIAE